MQALYEPVPQPPHTRPACPLVPPGLSCRIPSGQAYMPNRNHGTPFYVSPEVRNTVFAGSMPWSWKCSARTSGCLSFRVS